MYSGCSGLPRGDGRAWIRLDEITTTGEDSYCRAQLWNGPEVHHPLRYVRLLPPKLADIAVATPLYARIIREVLKGEHGAAPGYCTADAAAAI